MDFIIPIALFLIWIIIDIKNKKAMLFLPYLFMIFITPIYIILDRNLFVDIFGCGCVPSVQTNILEISFNANDLRLLVYSFIAIFMIILAGFNMKKIENRKLKIVYILTVILINVLVGYKICQMYIWN